jgi:hypothetical protein
MTGIAARMIPINLYMAKSSQFPSRPVEGRALATPALGASVELIPGGRVRALVIR